MYRQGDRVLYGIHGVCEIVGTEVRAVDRKKVEYFALEPLDQRGARFYVPTQNQAALAKLRPVLDEQALTALLQSEEVRADAWIPDESRRKLRYKELINSGDRGALMSMTASLYRHKQSQAAQGRKFHLSDENFLRDAEKILCAEISLVLNMQFAEAVEYLRRALTE